MQSRISSRVFGCQGNKERINFLHTWKSFPHLVSIESLEVAIDRSQCVANRVQLLLLVGYVLPTVVKQARIAEKAGLCLSLVFRHGTVSA